MCHQWLPIESRGIDGQVQHVAMRISVSLAVCISAACASGSGRLGYRWLGAPSDMAVTRVTRSSRMYSKGDSSCGR